LRPVHRPLPGGGPKDENSLSTGELLIQAAPDGEPSPC
jgi:hypothetical protein